MAAIISAEWNLIVLEDYQHIRKSSPLMVQTGNLLNIMGKRI